MNELSIEEKAKRFDEVIEKLRNAFYDNSRMCEEYREAIIRIIEPIFPELAESEDEKIRREIISALKYANYKGVYDKHIAWLEKQGEDMGISDTTKQKLKDNLDNVLEQETQESWNEFHENQGKQILANSAKTCKDAQKPAWSEEDNVFFKAIIRDIENVQYISEDAKKDRINWLKFLKERVQPQPKQEWSDWDKTIIESIEALCDEKIESVVFQDVKEHANDIKDWLTDLKERYAWKPSDEQMEQLHNVFNGTSAGWEDSVIESLYNDLKKLKG